jgi:hypothetical protein
MFNKMLEDYARTKKCKACGHWRFYWDKERNIRTFVKRNDICYCSSYPHPHRLKSKFCESHPKAEFNIRTQRHQEDAQQVAIDIAFDAPIYNIEECPF